MAKEMKISKSIQINKPRQEVYDYLRFTRNMDNYSVWNMADLDKKTTFTGTDGTVGFIYTWDSKLKNVGAGSQETLILQENEKIEFAVRFEKPMKNTGNSKFFLSDHGSNQTDVIWTFNSPAKFPMRLFMPIFRKMLGKDIATSLKNLKDILEK
jgi:uncharacterized membrane protein